MNVLSLFSGAEGIGLGLEAAGMAIRGQCEIEPAAIRILAHHWPHVPRWTDVREVTVDDVLATIGRPDIMVGGFPCQDLSMAGQRAGMAGERSGLYRELLRLARGLDPNWLVVENVPGLLSASADPDGGAPAGSAMGLFLGDLTGYFPPIPDGGWRNSGVIVGPFGSAAWRVLDARHFGVAQRRRRVFVVFHPRDRAAPGAVLLEPEGMSGHPAPRRPSWQGTPTLAGAGAEVVVSTLQATGGDRGYRVDAEAAAGGHLVPLAAEAYQCHGGNVGPMGSLRAGNGHIGSTPFVTHALTAEGADASEDGTGRGTPLVPWTAATLTAGQSKPGVSAPGRRQEDDTNLVPWTVSNDAPPVVTRDGTGALKVGTGLGLPSAPAVALAVRGRDEGAQIEVGGEGEPYNALRAGNGGSSRQSLVGIPTAAAVRRLTPLECERLMGWPDGHTAPAGSDSARYKACGNGVVANVAEWIGCRILDYSEQVVA